MARLPSLKNRKILASQVLDRLREIEPNPRCELYYETDYQLLVSVVLSAQCTDKMVNRCMEPLYKQGFNLRAALDLGIDGILEQIRTLGLAPTKAKNIFNLSRILIEEHDGEVPNSRVALEALPGVGRKTANVVLAEIFHHPTLAVDTHVFRVTNRLRLHNEKTADKAEKEILKVVDTSYLPAAHHWFILLGRYTCKAQKPLCSQCDIQDLCPTNSL